MSKEQLLAYIKNHLLKTICRWFSFHSSLVTLIESFWQEHPALIYGLSVLMGTGCAISWDWILLIPLLTISYPLVLLPNILQQPTLLLRYFLALAIGLMSFWYTSANYQFPQLEPGGTLGIANLSIHSISNSKTYFKKTWLYKGSLTSFIPEHSSDTKAYAKNIPYRLILPQESRKRPEADRDYIVKGRLKETSPGSYTFNPDPLYEWIPSKKRLPIAELRFKAKRYVTNHLQNQFHNPQVVSFLTGIATGDFNDSLLQFEFSRFGLQHIMAISGFHFAITAAILNQIFTWGFSKKTASCFLISILSLYCIFLGFGPSIMRAWIGIVIVLLSQLLERQSNALNTLGFALLVILLIDPLMAMNLGFQFSFLATAAILFFYAPIDAMLQTVWRKYPLSHLIAMNQLNQHGFVILAYCRQAIALTVAVHIIALPTMLFYFQKFPWLSIIYNLFYPFLVSFSILLLIVGCLFAFLFPPLAATFHHINNAYTQIVLNFVFNMPSSLDFTWRIQSLSSSLFIAYLTFVFIVGFFLRHRHQTKQELTKDFAFV